MTAPASQAFIERIFTLCGLLTTSWRNRTCKPLETRAFVKLNRNMCYLLSARCDHNSRTKLDNDSDIVMKCHIHN